MTIKLDDYRHDLITKILFASSTDEVRKFCETTLNKLEMQQLNGIEISLFYDKLIFDLEQFSPMNKEAEQWNNIVFAKVLCKRLVRQHSFSNE